MASSRSPTTVIPDVRHKDLIQAFAELRQRGFAVGVSKRLTLAPHLFYDVVAQAPAPRTRVEPGATVTLEPGLFNTALARHGPRSDTVPDVTGKTIAYAAARLHRAGYSWWARAPRRSPSVASSLLEAFCVTGQRLDEGTVRLVVEPSPS